VCLDVEALLEDARGTSRHNPERSRPRRAIRARALGSVDRGRARRDLPPERPPRVRRPGGRRADGRRHYSIDGGACEIVTIDSLIERGIGTALVEAVTDAARAAGCGRLWLVTTNDNLPALRFYQKRRFALVAVHREAVAEARKLKPEIPLVGLDGIPIRDELELELEL
jgi:GNAT superfamily N-acetyltransferase